MSHNYLQTFDLRVEDIIYIAHPFYGIDTIKIKSLPYNEPSTNSPFIKSQTIFSDWIHEGISSLNDAGLLPVSYNMRRTFRTKEEAESYIEYMLTLPSTHQHQKEHEERCAQLDDWLDM